MHKPFDPYHKWLSISPKDQPPNHYRLLGLDLFEPDADVISSAADQRMAHVRTFQMGPHTALSQKILNEIAAARVCLLNPETRRQYDSRLRAELAAISERTGSATGAVNSDPPILAPPARQPWEAPVAIRPDSSVDRRRRPNSHRWEAVTAIALALAICVGSIAVLRSNSGRQEVASQENGNPDSAEPAPNPAPAPAPDGNPPPGDNDAAEGNDGKERKGTKKSEERKETDGPSLETNELADTLGKARDAIALRELAKAREFIKEVKDIPKPPDKLQEEVARVRMLLEAHENFWKAVRAATGNLKIEDELKLDGTPVGSVVEVADNELTIHRQGDNWSYVIDENKPPKELPWEVAVALAERVQLLEGNTPTNLAIGAFLAVDYRGDRDEARHRLKLSGKQGEELMPELKLAGEVRPRPKQRGTFGKPIVDESDDGVDGKPEVPEEKVEKLPIPDSIFLAKAEEKLKDYLASFKSIRDRQDRLDALLAAAKANTNPAERFILYRYAVEASVDVADPYDIFGAIEKMDRHYAIDALAMKADGLQKAYRSKYGVPHRDALVRECEDLLAKAMAAKDYQTAHKAVRVAISGARAEKDFRHLAELEDEKKRIESLLPDRPQSD